MTAEPVPTISPEEYVAAERLADTKHEYVDGQVYAMAGASPPHSLIVGNLVGTLRALLRGKRCRAYSSDVRLQVEDTGLYTYPDVMVVCGRQRYADDRDDTLVNPKLLFEVLSSSTEAYDRGWKWAHYRRLETLAEYVLVAQDRPHVEHFVRQPDGTWVFSEVDDLDASLHLPSLGCEVPLAEIYYLVGEDEEE